MGYTHSLASLYLSCSDLSLWRLQALQAAQMRCGSLIYSLLLEASEVIMEQEPEC